MGSEKISLYVLIVVAAVVWPITSHYNSVTIITTSQIIQKAAATNATDTGKVFITNITGGADHLQGQSVMKTKNGMSTFIYLGIGPPGSSGDIGTIFYPKATGILAYLENKIAIYKDETFK